LTHSRTLDELRRADGPALGGKSASLGELLAAGIPVPPGFALATSAYEAFASGVGERTQAAMQAAAVPEPLREEVAARYAELASAVGDADPPVAVRSSAVGEDSEEATFAGQQESYLWVRGADAVCDAVRDCWASLFTERAISYRADRGDAAAQPTMGVAVQLMVDAVVSGVMFTCNPVSGDPSMVAINASWGLGLAVVGGEVTPDDYLVSKITREVVREHVHDKHIEYVPDPAGHGAVARDVAADRRGARTLDEATIGRLVDVGRTVERHFGSHQDIEWAIARGSGEELYVVQSRPVTTAHKPEAKPAPASALSLVMNTFGVKTDDGA
jgi:phosphoenolpyruvate synthase/pyruvate phosphate dikinase